MSSRIAEQLFSWALPSPWLREFLILPFSVKLAAGIPSLLLGYLILMNQSCCTLLRSLWNIMFFGICLYGKPLFYLFIWLIICLDSKPRSKIIFHRTLKAWFHFCFWLSHCCWEVWGHSDSLFFSAFHFPENLQYCASMWKSFHLSRWILTNLLQFVNPDISVLGVFLSLSMGFLFFQIFFCPVLGFHYLAVWNSKIKPLKFYLCYVSSILTFGYTFWRFFSFLYSNIATILFSFFFLLLYF